MYASVRNKKRGISEPGAFINLNSICDCIIIISCPGTVAYSGSIQILKIDKGKDECHLNLKNRLSGLDEDGRLINNAVIVVFSIHLLIGLPYKPVK